MSLFTWIRRDMKYGDPSCPNSSTRREFLRSAGCGFGMVALTALLSEQNFLAASPSVSDESGLNPLAPKQPQRDATAKRVIFLFMSGGPSHLETFDPKPDLQRLHGERLPASFGPVKTRRGVDKNKLLATK